MKKNACQLMAILLVFNVFLGKIPAKAQQEIIPAAYRTQVYLPWLKGKRVAVFANHTSTIGQTHLVDSLLAMGINVVKAFGPEHGFRGTADAGEKIETYIDAATGIPVISLYGKKRRPSAEDLANVDLLIFDIQDVGVRFYTYISSLQEYMEAAFEHKKPLLILDRPNPNGHYVDGPVLDTNFKSFIGMQPVPIVYGMTIGEYANMIAGEGWLSAKANEQRKFYATAQNSADTPFHFQILKCIGYNHNSVYNLPVKPSPNLPNLTSIYWYGSTCFFEGTVLSEGRGTDYPFTVFGHPQLPNHLYAFTPTSRDGAKEPKFKNQLCYGWNVHEDATVARKKINQQIQLRYLLEAYQLFKEKNQFFLKPKVDKPENYFFNKLAGNALLMQQLKDGKTETEIRQSWQPALQKFKAIRKKYLLYPDFE
jgi:uncharacterized protein YbbC (DUF1343 family)